MAAFISSNILVLPTPMPWRLPPFIISGNGLASPVPPGARNPMSASLPPKAIERYERGSVPAPPISIT
jgi:hypothetical protein